MAENVPESLDTVALPQQIMAQTDSIAVVQEATTNSSSNSEGNQEIRDATTNIPSTIDGIQGTAESISSISNVNMAEETTTSEGSLSGNETISVSTQVNIINESENMAMNETEFGEQPMIHAPAGHVISEENMVQDDTETVSIPQDTISMVSDGTIVRAGEPLPMAPTSLASPLPPWAARLRDCELIGDSYRGYVTNEVELDLILTLHKQHTNSCWGTRQSPSSAKPSIRLMWKSQYVPYDGIPFLNTGRRATVMECQYGPRRKGSCNKKSNEYDNEGNILKKEHRPTCPARIYIKKVRKFPEYRIDLGLNLEGKNVRQAQERALTHLRLAGVESGGEERFYVQLPLPIAHEYHDIEDIPITISPEINTGQRLNQEVADRIQELVARGVTGVYTIKHCLKEFVEKELYIGQEAPPRHNKAFFPTIIDLQNHIHQAQNALNTGSLLPLPPMNNLPVIPSSNNKERVRKRKHPEKLSQTSQTIHRLQTAEAVASIQNIGQVQMDQDGQSSDSVVEHSGIQQDNNNQLQEQLENLNEQEGQQILITHGQQDPSKNGQVVIVVTSNNVFNGQESDTPTTFALTTLPSSQLTNMQQTTSFGTLTTGNQAVLIAQQGENGQFLAHTQSGNILTVMNPNSLQGATPTEGVVLRMVANPGTISTAAAPVDSQAQPSAPEQLLASQAAVAAVLNAAATVENPSSMQQDISNQQQEGNSDGEPPVKRQAVGIDLSSLVKEAGFDAQQVQVASVNMSGESGATSAQATGILVPHPCETTENTHSLSQQEYTNTVTEAPLYSYSTTSIDSKQPTQVVAVHMQHVAMETGDERQGTSDESIQQSTLAAAESYQVLQDQASNSVQIQQGTVDVRQIQPVVMTTDLMENYPVSKFSKSSGTETVIVASSQSGPGNNGIVQQSMEQLDSELVLIGDDESESYQTTTLQNNRGPESEGNMDNIAKECNSDS